jgi:hypothetical protein
MIKLVAELAVNISWHIERTKGFEGVLVTGHMVGRPTVNHSCITDQLHGA